MATIFFTVKPEHNKTLTRAITKYVTLLEDYGLNHSVTVDKDQHIPIMAFKGKESWGLNSIVADLKQMIIDEKPIEMIIEELAHRMVYDPKGIKPLTTEEIRAIQSKYNTKYFDLGSQFATIRHVTLHMGKLLGKLSAYCEANEHYLQDVHADRSQSPSQAQIRDDIIPDLIIYSATLSTLLGNNMTNSYIARMANNLRSRKSEK